MSTATAPVVRDADVRILRRWDGEFEFAAADKTAIVAVIDTEATGVDYEYDRVVEVGVVLAAIDPATGRIVEVVDSYDALQDPGHPLSDEVKQVTGLSDDDLAGQSIDWNRVWSMLSQARVIIAHNAKFDRALLRHGLGDGLDFTVWGCSYRDVAWLDIGLRRGPLELLTMLRGWFYTAHRALDDAMATLHLLTEDGGAAMASLIQTVSAHQVELSFAGDRIGDLGALLKGKHGWRWDRDRSAWVYRATPAEAQLMRDTVRETSQGWIRVEARGVPFKKNDAVRSRGYRFDRDRKSWWKVGPRDVLALDRQPIADAGGELVIVGTCIGDPEARRVDRSERHR